MPTIGPCVLPPLRPALAAVVILGAACGSPERGEAVIGYAHVASVEAPIRVAEDALQEAGPADGPPIRFIRDSVSDAGESVIEEEARARRMVAWPGLVAVVGHGGSRGTFAAAPVYSAARIPLLVPTGTHRGLDSLGPWVFRLAPNDVAEGAFIAGFLVERLKRRRIAIVYHNDEYGHGLLRAVRAALGARGVAPLAEVAILPEADFGALLDQALRASGLDAVVIAARYPEAGSITRLLHARAPAVAIVVADAVADEMDNLRRIAGPGVDSLYFVSFWIPDTLDAADRAFVDRYRRVVGRDPTPIDAMRHDAMMALVQAVWTVGPDPERVRDYLRSLGVTRPPLQGVTGPVGFTPEIRRQRGFTMGRLRDGRLRRVHVAGP